MNPERSERIEIPVLPLRDVVVYPHMVIPLFVGREKSIRCLEAAMDHDKKIMLVAQKEASTDEPGVNDLFTVGTVASILQMLKLPDGTVKVLVEGEQRGAVERFSEVDGHCRAEVSLIDEVDAPARESEVFVRSLLSQFEQYVQLGKKVPAEVLSSLNSIDEPSRLVDTMAAHMALKIEQKQEILEIIDLQARVEHVLALLDAWTDEIAQGLAGMVHIFNPQLILIGGGVSAQQKLLIEPIAAKVRASVMPAFAEGLEIRAAQLHNDAGMVGAVYYFRQQHGEA